MDNDIDRKIKDIKGWNKERERIKPIIDIAIDYHNKARAEVYLRNYKAAIEFYKEAIKNYRSAISLKPKYYFQDLIERIDHVVEEYINSSFNLRVSGDRLKSESGISEFIDFVDSLKDEEKRYINSYEFANAYFTIAKLYYEEGDFKKAYEFYNRVVDIDCGRPFINRDSYFKMGEILFEQGRFKEALVSFVSALSFDRDNREIVEHIEGCLKRLGIAEYRDKFLVATPKGARKLIMEVL